MTTHFRFYLNSWGYSIIKRINPTALIHPYTIVKRVEVKGTVLSIYQKPDGTFLMEEKGAGILYPNLYEVKETLKDVYEVTEEGYQKWFRTQSENIHPF